MTTFRGRSKDGSEGKVDGQRVRLDIMDVDRYRRMVSIVWVGNRDINREMVSEGWAWAYRVYLKGPYASEFIRDEGQARNGLDYGKSTILNRRGRLGNFSDNEAGIAD